MDLSVQNIVVEPPELKLPHTKPDSFMKVALFAALIACGMALYLFWQNQQLSYQLAISRQLVASPNPSLSLSPVTGPTIDSMGKGDIPAEIFSPVSFQGTVPSGWMFEGQFPIEIRDSEDKLVGSGVGKEVDAGSWSSGNPVIFDATILFQTQAKEGYILLLSDNPSGLPDKQLTYKLPVKFIK